MICYDVLHFAHFCSIRMGVRSWSVSSLPLETCGDCSLSPHDLSAYMEDAGKVPV